MAWGKELVFIGIIFGLITIYFVMYWKDIVVNLMPFRFYRVQFNLKVGTVKSGYVLISKKNPNTVIFNKKEYFISETSRMWKKVKFFEFNEDNPLPIDKKLDLGQNLDLELQRKEIKFFELFKEKKTILDLLGQYLMPVIMGILIGVVGMMIQYRDCVFPQ